MATRFTSFYSVIDVNGEPLSGALLYFYEAGTTTPLDTYSDDALTTANDNPVVANASGVFGDIFLQAQDYKAVLKTPAGVTLDTLDPIHGGSSVVVAIEDGGTGSTSASDARTALGLGTAATGDVGVDVQAYDAATAKTDVAQEYTAQQNFGLATLTDAASIAWDLETQQVAEVTLTDNRALANPTNQVAGGTYILFVRQDATGGRTLSTGTAYKLPSSTAFTLTTNPDAVDILTFVSDGTFMHGVAQFDFGVP